MFENVLVGVNGRPSGRDAVVLASSLTDPAGELTLAHVHPGEVHRLHGVAPGRLAEEHEASMSCSKQSGRPSMSKRSWSVSWPRHRALACTGRPSSETPT
jgi:hypothetical protein